MDDMLVTHAVAVSQCAGKRYGGDLHVVVQMHIEASARLDHVVGQHAQLAKLHPLRIMVAGETEGMPAVQPACIFPVQGRPCSLLRLNRDLLFDGKWLQHPGMAIHNSSNRIRLNRSV
jgi:hypothetical protein